MLRREPGHVERVVEALLDPNVPVRALARRYAAREGLGGDTLERALVALRQPAEAVDAARARGALAAPADVGRAEHAEVAQRFVGHGAASVREEARRTVGTLTR